MTAELIAKSHQTIWHPCSQMKDYESFPPLIVTNAQGSYIEVNHSHKIIDAISSWWCKSLGHQHPRLKQAMLEQMDEFEHVIFANLTYEKAINLAEKLLKLVPGMTKVFFAGDGSCAVEIAMKMSLHARQIQGREHQKKFLALTNGYHGETTGAMSISDVGIYCNPYKTMLFATHFLTPVYVSGREDPLWEDISELWPNIEKQLDALASDLTAVVIEPIVQGAAGMKIYSADFLRRLRNWTLQHDIHLIADEIMTGVYRTGKFLACEYAEVTPDIVCLGKGLTSGWLSFSAVLIKQEIYDLFYADYSAGKNFLHSHTYCGNPLGVSLALATLEIMATENIGESVQAMEKILMKNMFTISERTGRLCHVRGIGAIVAADIITDKSNERIGYQVYKKAIKLGALLRPLGNTIYWLPPLNTSAETLARLEEITESALNVVPRI